MKKCPVCKSIVSADSECPICQTTITYEPPVMEEKERIGWNKHSCLYLLKNMWFSLLCCIIVTVVYLASKPEIDYLFCMAIFCAVISLCASIFHRKLASYMKRRYTDEYIAFKISQLKYFIGGIAIFLFVVIGLMS